MMKILHDENLEYTSDPVAPRKNNEVRASGTIFTFVFSRAEDHQLIPHSMVRTLSNHRTELIFHGYMGEIGVSTEKLQSLTKTKRISLVPRHGNFEPRLVPSNMRDSQHHKVGKRRFSLYYLVYIDITFRSMSDKASIGPGVTSFLQNGNANC